MEKMLANGGTSLWSCRTGTGDLPVVMLNGGPGCDDYLGPVAEVLHDLCTVVRFEPRGCGRSSWDGNYDLDTAVADIDFVRFSSGFDTCVLIGHSWGSDLGLVYALAHPNRVRGLIGVAGGRLVNDRDWHAAYVSKREQELRPEYLSDERVNGQLNAEYKAYLKREDLFREVSRLGCPARFVAGQADIRPSWPIRQLSRLLPDGGYVELSGADHYPWISAPDAFREALTGVVRETFL